MHQYLRLSALSSLPISIRGSVTEAAQGGLQGLIRTVAWIQSPAIPIRHKYSVLAAIYPNLDVAGIPEIGDFDVPEPASSVHEAVTRANIASICLQKLVVMAEIPPAAFKDLWPRYWPWASFFYTFHEQLSWLAPKRSDSQVACHVLMIVDHTRFCREMEAFLATPESHGFDAMVVAAWASTLRREDPITPEDYPVFSQRAMGLLDIDHCWESSDINHQLEEMIDGAGGSIENLASLFVRHINRTLSLEDALGPTGLHILTDRIFWLAVRMEQKANPPEGTGSMVLTPLSSALLNQGILSAAVAVVCAFSRNSEARPEGTPETCLALLVRLLFSVEGFRRLPEAVESGLLKALVSFDRISSSDDSARSVSNDHLTKFWEGILPQSLVFYHVVSKLDLAIHEVDNTENTDKFTAQTRAAWRKFKVLARRRLEVLAIFNAPGYTAYRACDNLECTRIREKTSFRRCSGCQNAYYCSARCQRHDWYNDGHRQACRLDHSLSLSSHSTLDTKEREFLRALANHDYHILANKARLAQSGCMHLYPGTAFFTVFKYHWSLDVDIEVCTENEKEWTVVTANPRWGYAVKRMVKGGTKLHVLAIREGDVVRYSSSRAWGPRNSLVNLPINMVNRISSCMIKAVGTMAQ
ncbi:hypothetical protein DFH06DRAFT_1189354 [Mycena polygramma]|nr:hypothetical protein DFH06DRAFT_1189354 [Mycena polygramma]